MSNMKFFSYFFCYQVLITPRLYNTSKNINIIKGFFLLIAMTNLTSFIFQYITK